MLETQDPTTELTPDALDELQHDSWRSHWGLDDLRELAQRIAEAQVDIRLTAEAESIWIN